MQEIGVETCQEKKRSKKRISKRQISHEYWKLKQYQRDCYKSKRKKNEILLFLYSMKMSKKTLKFNSLEVNKKKFDASKQSIALNLVNVNQILISDKC